MPTNIKPCPFCGYVDAEVYDDFAPHPYTGADGFIAYVICINEACCARGPVAGEEELIPKAEVAHAKAIQLWNERSE